LISTVYPLIGTNWKDEAKFAFVDTNTNDEITILHTKSRKEFLRTINGNAQDKTVRPSRD